MLNLLLLDHRQAAVAQWQLNWRSRKWRAAAESLAAWSSLFWFIIMDMNTMFLSQNHMLVSCKNKEKPSSRIKRHSPNCAVLSPLFCFKCVSVFLPVALLLRTTRPDSHPYNYGIQHLAVLPLIGCWFLQEFIHIRITLFWCFSVGPVWTVQWSTRWCTSGTEIESCGGTITSSGMGLQLCCQPTAVAPCSWSGIFPHAGLICPGGSGGTV